MRILSKQIYPNAKKCLDIALRKYGDSKAVVVGGALLGVGKNTEGEDTAVLTLLGELKKGIDMDSIENALKSFVDGNNDSQQVKIVERADLMGMLKDACNEKA